MAPPHTPPRITMNEVSAARLRGLSDELGSIAEETGDPSTAAAAAAAAAAAQDHDLVKVSLNLPRSVMRKVEQLASRMGVNKTTVIRRAIDLEAYFETVRAKNGKVLVKEGREIKEVIFR